MIATMYLIGMVISWIVFAITMRGNAYKDDTLAAATCVIAALLWPIAWAVVITRVILTI